MRLFTSLIASALATQACGNVPIRLIQMEKQNHHNNDGSLRLVQPTGAAHAGSESMKEAAAIETTLISRIFVMCVVMYGGIALLWGVNIKSGSPESFRIALLIISWASCSVGMHVLNKALVDYLAAPALISGFQMALTVGVCAGTSGRDVMNAPRSQIMRWLIVPIFFAGMLISAFYAYARISLTLLTLVRNLTPLLMLPLETIFMAPDKRPAVSVNVVVGILIMLAGAIVYSGGNLASISMIGVGFACLNMVLAVTDRLLQRRLLTTECKDLSSGVCTILNNFGGMLPTLLLAATTGQFAEAAAPQQAARWTQPYVLVLLVLSGLVGTGISLLGIECQRAISATSFSVMQNVSKVAVVSAGVVFFSDPIGSRTSMVGLLLSLGGSFLYGLAQQRATADAKAKMELGTMGTDKKV